MSIQATARRRTTPTQGRALETLGHAIEYLIDSRLSDQIAEPTTEAVRILMSCSRAVFEECEALLPWHERMQRMLGKRFARAGEQSGASPSTGAFA
jgi:hypothetical protein